MYAETQRAVHTDTGALLASGDLSTEYDHATATWSATIGYGNTPDTLWGGKGGNPSREFERLSHAAA